MNAKLQTNKIFEILQESKKRITVMQGGSRSGKTYNINRDKIILFYDFLSSLYNLVDDTFLGADVLYDELEKETTAMSWRTIPSTENGTVFYEAEVNARLHKVTTAQRNEIKLLAQNRMLLIVKDAEDVYWLLGGDYGVQLNQSETNFGQAFGDFKGHVLNFLHKETDLPLKVQSAVVTSLGIS